MIAHIMNDGDASVGIDGDYIAIDLPAHLMEEREATRKILHDAFVELFDNIETVVIFDDEPNKR